MDSQTSSSPPSNGGNSLIRAAIVAVVVAVSAGYLILWVMMPTNTFMLHWLPVLRAKTNSTYFGMYQGETYLMFTFPILFIAVLGCVYLHLVKKARDHNHIKGGNEEYDQRLGIWKRPVIIKGLGIVSWIELSFFLMFIALLIWNLATHLHIGFANITPAKLGQKVWQVKLETAALRLGLVGNIALSFLFYPVTRGSSVLPLFGLTSEASIKYHIWLGHIVMTIFTAHGLCYITFWATTHELSEMLKWDKTGVSNVAGELSLVAGLALWATTFPTIRRKFFELFFYTHHLYILFVLFFVFHVGISFTSITLPAFFLFMIDRYLRFLQSRRHVRLLSARLLSSPTLELNFSKTKDMSYTPTSIMFINIPSLSKLQWHPFTISSSSNLESDKLSVIIKADGSWTNKLYQLLSSPLSLDRLDVSIEGPYGPASTDFLRHDILVMICGGSGITPFISIIRELIYTNNTLNRETPQILLITAFKNSTDLTMLDLIIPISGLPSSSQLSEMGLQIEAYVTREKQPPSQEKTLRTVWFKPNPSDMPMSPVLGPNNNWLWLGAIILSSFVIYLVSIGILTRYYIYPIDRNTDSIYSSSYRSALHVLFMCTGIVIAGTIGFVWNKRKNAGENIQIRSMEGATTPQASPGSSFYNADREMESLPQQSLSESIIVHYGERPDLKNICSSEKNRVLVFLFADRRN
ncbi:hypothetical protein CASFOL_033561 [Castilleja foliolosa]|uniref:ferric-chelate reductase (NADH) n=1 Tax=Castilleja foliolosa TaxID=1961234 RepID=A0ABD3BZR3_9LAMI